MLQTSSGPVPQDTAMELQHDLKARVPLFTSQFHSFFVNAKVDFSNFVFQVSDLQRCVPTKMWGTWSAWGLQGKTAKGSWKSTVY